MPGNLSQVLVQGIATGLIYALVGAGFVLVFRTAGLFNFAHTESYTIGAFVAFFTVSRLGLSYWQGILIAGLVAGVVGIITERLAFRQLLVRSAPPVNLIVASIALGIILRALSLLVWGPDPQAVQGASQVVALGSIIITLQNILILLTVVASFAGLGLLLYRTHLGVALRAVADNRIIASVMGIDYRLTLPFAFGLAGVLGGVAGALVAPTLFPQFRMGQAVLVKAFSASVIGGLDSIVGAVAGGLLIDLFESLVGSYINSAYKDSLAFALLIVVLIIRPTGILGRYRVEKV